MKNRTKSNTLFCGGSLRLRLLCIFFLLIIIPMGLFTFYTFYRVKEVMYHQTLSAAGKTFDEASASLEDTLLKLDRVLDILVMDSIIYRMSSNDPDDYSYIQRLEDSNSLSATFSHLCTLSDVDRLQLYVHNTYLYSDEQSGIIQASEVMDSAWYKSLGMDASRKDNRLWLSPVDFYDQPEDEKHWYSTVRVIYNLRDFDSPLAVIRADVDATRISSILSDAAVTPNGMLLMQKGGRVLLCSGEGAAGSDRLAAGLPDLADGQWTYFKLDGERFYAKSSMLSNTGWTLTTIVPYGDVYRLSTELRFEMLVVMIVLSVLAYILALAISHSTLSRISLLAQTMHSVESGSVGARVTPQGVDEIGQLMGSFNRMIERIDSLMEEKVEYGRQIKNLELKALQAQINPHFLYNSLDLINCTAIANNVPQISGMVNALARFYKLSLSRGSEIIPVKDELNHARLYVDIQNMRFEGRVNVEWNIDSRVNGYRIIKIVLQPVIENAIIHGIFERSDKTGVLKVSASLEEGKSGESRDIRITIEDNGVGMDRETLMSNFTPAAPAGIAWAGGGYGIRNINDRLHLAYGDSYGLSCESTPGLGTTVTLLIPAVV